MYRFLILQIIAGIVGGIIASKKGRNYLIWSLLCFVFPVSILFLFILPPQVTKGRRKKCPYCSRVIHETETICRHCNKELPINLVQCKECASFVPAKDYCMQCNKKLKS